MNYKVLAHEFTNTGGNCMVNITDVWLPDENKTVYVYTNEDGCTIATADYIRHCLDVDDCNEFIMDSLYYCDLTADQIKAHNYFELYRDCIFEFTKQYCKYFKCKRALPYCLLSKEMQSQITAEYRTWFEENVSEKFAIDGDKVILSSGYKPYKPLQTEKEKLVFALWQFKYAHRQLAKVWQEAYYIDLSHRKANESYPFTSSFDELEVGEWVDKLVDELTAEEN